MLSAGNQDSMMQWINHLQSKRNNYNSRNAQDFSASTVFIAGICDDPTVTQDSDEAKGKGKVAMIKNYTQGS